MSHEHLETMKQKQCCACWVAITSEYGIVLTKTNSSFYIGMFSLGFKRMTCFQSISHTQSNTETE